MKEPKIIKSNTYNIINPEPFEIPFPLVFELLSGNTLLAEYSISEDGVVDYGFNPTTNEKILTSTLRPLTLTDIYFLFTSRVFPDKTPYTAFEMERFGIEEYHVYTIIRKTRGMLPGDKYWLRFEKENINYKQALQEFTAYYENSYKKYIESLEKAAKEQEAEQEKQKLPDEDPPGGREFDPQNLPPADGKMSDEEIAAMLAMFDMPALEEPEPEPEPEPSGDKLSDEDIAAMLSQIHTAEVETSHATEKMSADEIAAMFAAASGDDAPEPEPAAEEPEAPAEPEPVAEEPEPVASESGNMSPEAIAALLAQNTE